MHYDLLTHGFHPLFVGSPGLSWHDLKVLVNEFEKRPATAYYRALHPTTWMWDTFEGFMAAEQAKHQSRLVYLNTNGDEIPDDWYPRTYEPPTTDTDQFDTPQADESAARARAVADDIRNGL